MNRLKRLLDIGMIAITSNEGYVVQEWIVFCSLFA